MVQVSCWLLDAIETPRELAFCAHAIVQTSPMIVPDATLDETLRTTLFFTSNPNIRFYAGVPLRRCQWTIDRHPRAIDSKPRKLNADEINILIDLAAVISKE